MAAIGTPYITAEQLRAYLSFDENNILSGPAEEADAALMENLQSAVDAASRQIEQFCNRQFNRQEFATPREFYVDLPGEVTTDDFWDVEGFTISQGYTSARFEPRNGVVNGMVGWPFYRVKYDGGYGYENPDEVVTITAKWGWPVVPSTVIQATKIVAAQNFKLSEAPMGVTGMGGEFGGVMRIRDIPMARQMLDQFVRDPIMVA